MKNFTPDRPKGEFDENERARIRDMLIKMDAIYPYLDKFVGIMRSGVTLAAVFGTLFVLAGAIRWAVAQGWFG